MIFEFAVIISFMAFFVMWTLHGCREERRKMKMLIALVQDELDRIRRTK